MKISKPSQFCIDLDRFLTSAHITLIYTINKKKELKKVVNLLASMYLLQQMSIDDSGEKYSTLELNRVIQKHLGPGHTWVSCTQLLAGAKAQEINAKYQDIISSIGGIRLSLLAEYALPDIQRKYRQNILF